MTQATISFIIAAVVWSVFALGIEIAIMEKVNGTDISDNQFTPSYFYHEVKLNWFGAWVTTIIIGIVSPIMAAFKLVYWLFHVGRKEED